MIAHQQLDAASLRGEGQAIFHLSRPDCPRWAGFHTLPPSGHLSLGPRLRHDVFLFRGELAVNERWLPAGSFFSRGGDAVLAASKSGAAFFLYRDSMAPMSANETVPPASRVWHGGAVPGMSVATLSEVHHRVSLVSWAAGTRVPPHTHPQGEEILVLRGELQDERGLYPAGAWLRFSPGSGHAPFAETPTLILLRSGHLDRKRLSVTL